MIYNVEETEEGPRHYLVMEPIDFDGFVLVYKLAVFDDDGMIFTQYQGIQIVKRCVVDNE